MNICVCFKIVPDYDQIVEADWENITNGLDDSYVKRMIGCFDESALETALRIRDSCGVEQCYVTAVTVGERLADNFVKTLYAVGVSEVIHIRTEAQEIEFNPEYVASRLSDYIRSNRFDMILTGRQAGAGDSGSVPYYLAERLGWPVISEVCDYEMAEVDKGIIIRHLVADRMAASLVTGPVVLSVGNCEHAYLRMAALKARLAVKGKECCLIESEPDRDIGHYKVNYLRYPHKKRECRMLDVDNSEDAGMWLWETLTDGEGSS